MFSLAQKRINFGKKTIYIVVCFTIPATEEMAFASLYGRTESMHYANAEFLAAGNQRIRLISSGCMPLCFPKNVKRNV